MARLLIAALFLLQSSTNGVITGRLTTAGGAPASGTRVALRPVSDTPPSSDSVQVSISETDAAGRYRLDNVPPGRYLITAGQVGRPTFYPGTLVSDDAAVIAVRASETVNVPDFTLQSAS